MKSIKLLTTLLVLSVVLFSACSKQTKLEKRLDGTWNIDLYNYEERENGVVDPDSKETISNAGTIVLTRNDKTNTGTITMTFLGMTFIQTITEWSNTEDKITIKSTDGTTVETTVFDIVTNEKDNQEWKNTETMTVGGVSVVGESTYKLSRK